MKNDEWRMINEEFSLEAANSSFYTLKYKIMADLNVSGNLTVAGLKKRFKDTFGCSLRVYTTPQCKSYAKEDATLASIRAEGAKGGELTVGSNLRVGNFEKKMEEVFGIYVQVATPDDSKLAKNDLTLAAAGRE